MLTTVIGAYPKPDYLKITDWFNAKGGTDTANPTELYEDEIKKMEMPHLWTWQLNNLEVDRYIVI